MHTHTYARTHAHTHTHTCTHTCTHTRTYLHMHARTHTHTHTHTHTSMHACMHTHTHTHIHSTVWGCWKTQWLGGWRTLTTVSRPDSAETPRNSKHLQMTALFHFNDWLLFFMVIVFIMWSPHCFHVSWYTGVYNLVYWSIQANILSMQPSILEYTT